MSQELISTWLGLAAGEWPPNHYRLLGLQPGESDGNLIEERVHQRLDMVRRYQMMHPDQATEAMNLLAQAFVCLTDPAAKKVYDYDLGLNGAARPAQTATAAPVAEPPDPDEPAVVLYNPTEAGVLAPPVQVQFAGTSAPPVRVPFTETTTPPPVAQIVPDAVAVPVEEALPVEVLQPHVPPAQPSGRAARRLLYRRAARARKLLGNWNQLGKYIGSTKRRLTRPAEAVDFLQQLEGIRTLVPELPPVLGQAGQVGYHVLTLAQLNSVPMFQTLAPEQREVLSRDWHDSLKVLEDHRAALRTQIDKARRQGLVVRGGRAVARLVRNHPGAVLAALAGLSLVVVLFRTFVFDWLPKHP